MYKDGIDRSQYVGAGQRSGRFAGSPDYVVCLWEFAMSAGFPLEGEPGIFVPLSAEDKAWWPELACYGVIELWESDDGAVGHRLYRTADCE